jgi:2-dehydro-3-deoxyphosphogalactonate aldolase
MRCGQSCFDLRSQVEACAGQLADNLTMPATSIPPAPPLVAILRGLESERAVAVARTLFDAGFRILEVPLNRPGALQCIAAIVAMAPAGTLIGGGTMLTPADVDAVHAAGGRLTVAPNCDAAVIRRSRELGMFCAPGIATPSEAFAALAAGADVLKLFPAEMIGAGGLKAMASVLPPGTGLWPVA